MQRVSVQGTGMGMPSISIYANELIQSYGVKNLIIAMVAYTDSNINSIRFNGSNFAPTASFKLLKKSYDIAVEMEAAALYIIAAKHGVDALALLTVSDHFISGEVTTAEERQTTFTKMIEVALETVYTL